MNKRNNWFNAYQEIPGVTGGMRRLQDRVELFLPSDFENSTVLDMGCNVGQMCFWAAQQGARSVTGVEFDAAAFSKAIAYRKEVGLSREVVTFKLDDLDLPTAWHNLPTHDVVMFLSMIDTKELKNRFGMLARACMKTKNVMYLEGHLKQPAVKYINYLLDYTDFTSIKCLGARGGRSLFRCTRHVLGADEFNRTIIEAANKYRRIGVIGNQLSGKTTLLRQMPDLPQGWQVLDDCRDFKLLGDAEKLLLFDYRGAVYCDDFDVIFNVLQPRECFEERRSGLEFLRSSNVKHPSRLVEFHTVMGYGTIDC